MNREDFIFALRTAVPNNPHSWSSSIFDDDFIDWAIDVFIDNPRVIIPSDLVRIAEMADENVFRFNEIMATSYMDDHSPLNRESVSSLFEGMLSPEFARQNPRKLSAVIYASKTTAGNALLRTPKIKDALIELLKPEYSEEVTEVVSYIMSEMSLNHDNADYFSQRDIYSAVFQALKRESDRAPFSPITKNLLTVMGQEAITADKAFATKENAQYMIDALKVVMKEEGRDLMREDLLHIISEMFSRMNEPLPFAAQMGEIFHDFANNERALESTAHHDYERLELCNAMHHMTKTYNAEDIDFWNQEIMLEDILKFVNNDREIATSFRLINAIMVRYPETINLYSQNSHLNDLAWRNIDNPNQSIAEVSMRVLASLAQGERSFSDEEIVRILPFFNSDNHSIKLSSVRTVTNILARRENIDPDILSETTGRLQDVLKSSNSERVMGAAIRGLNNVYDHTNEVIDDPDLENAIYNMMESSNEGLRAEARDFFLTLKFNAFPDKSHSEERTAAFKEVMEKLQDNGELSFPKRKLGGLDFNRLCEILETGNLPITRLDLNGQNIGDREAIFLAGKLDKSSLTYIKLPNNHQVNHDGVTALKKALSAISRNVTVEERNGQTINSVLLKAFKYRKVDQGGHKGNVPDASAGAPAHEGLQGGQQDSQGFISAANVGPMLLMAVVVAPFAWRHFSGKGSSKQVDNPLLDKKKDDSASASEFTESLDVNAQGKQLQGRGAGIGVWQEGIRQRNSESLGRSPYIV